MTLKILMVSVKHINTFSIYILKIEDSNKAYKYFLGIFIGIYDQSLPKTEVKVKLKNKTWSIMKEILGKCPTKSSTLPTKVILHKTDIFDAKKRIADKFNKFLQT